MNFKEEMYQEDINKIACDVCDLLQELLNNHNIELPKDKEDKCFDSILEILDSYSVGYRNYN